MQLQEHLDQSPVTPWTTVVELDLIASWLERGVLQPGDTDVDQIRDQIQEVKATWAAAHALAVAGRSIRYTNHLRSAEGDHAKRQAVESVIRDQMLGAYSGACLACEAGWTDGGQLADRIRVRFQEVQDRRVEAATSAAVAYQIGDDAVGRNLEAEADRCGSILQELLGILEAAGVPPLAEEPEESLEDVLGRISTACGQETA